MQKRISRIKTHSLIALTVLVCLLLLLAGCGQSGSAVAGDAVNKNEAEYDNMSAGGGAMADFAPSETAAYMESAESTPAGASQKQQKKIIHTASMEMKTTRFEETVRNIEQQVAAIEDAYFETKSISSNNGSYKSAYFTVRVPVQNLTSFTDKMHEVAAVTSENQDAEDVSEYYYDTDSRLANQKIKLERLQALLAEATSMEDIITLESAISDVEYEIESLQGTLNHLDSRVDYATVTISLRESEDVTVNDVPLSFGEKIKQSFHNGLKNVQKVMEAFAIWAVANWIWILLFFVAPLIALCIVLHVMKKKKKESQIQQTDTPSGQDMQNNTN